MNDLLTEAHADALLRMARSPWGSGGDVSTGAMVALRNRGLLASVRHGAELRWGRRVRDPWTEWTVTDAGRAKVAELELGLKATEQRRRDALGSATVPRWALLRLLSLDGEVRGPNSIDEAKAELCEALGEPGPDDR